MKDVSVLTRSLRTIGFPSVSDPSVSRDSHERRRTRYEQSAPGMRRRQDCNFREQYGNRNG
jgi:hypothetical protein